MTSPLDDARGELLTQAIAAADGIDLLQDSRHLRRRTAEILRELVALTRAAPVPQCGAEPLAWDTGEHEGCGKDSERAYKLGEKTVSLSTAVDAELAVILDSAESVQRCDAENAALVCAEAYQVVGSLLSDLGQFDTERGQKILDNLSDARMVHDDILPWPSFETSEAGREAIAWLIERDGKWWGPPCSRWDWQQALVAPDLWTTDANKAIRFARRDDAEAYMRFEGLAGGSRATEHKWLSSPDQGTVAVSSGGSDAG